jgi:hypothetical protein
MRWTPPILVAAPRSGQALRMPLSRSAAETRWGRFPYAGGGPAHRSVGQPSNFGEDADRIGEDVAAGADPRELAVHFEKAVLKLHTGSASPRPRQVMPTELSVSTRSGANRSVQPSRSLRSHRHCERQQHRSSRSLSSHCRSASDRGMRQNEVTDVPSVQCRCHPQSIEQKHDTS